MYDRCEELNYFRDSRNCAPDSEPTVHIEQPDGSQLEVKLPTKWVVCPACDGKGTHVNPSIDCNGLTSEDFASDPDFAEEYFAGRYDQTCNRCNGRTTVRAVDEERLTDAQRAAWEAEMRAESDSYNERMAEIRAGC